MAGGNLGVLFLADILIVGGGDIPDFGFRSATILSMCSRSLSEHGIHVFANFPAWFGGVCWFCWWKMVDFSVGMVRESEINSLGFVIILQSVKFFLKKKSGG